MSKKKNKNLLNIKTRLYRNNFQLQFSLHSTDEKQRDELVPVKKWDFKTISEYGNLFYESGNRKIILNFALGEKNIMDISELKKHFNPDIFLIKITPVNPTFQANKNNISSLIKPGIKNYTIIENLKKEGYDVILSIGEPEENKIGSNCGQYINALKNNKINLKEVYTYQVVNV